MRVGGQAVIEGVLMIGKYVSLAVRNKEGKIVVKRLGEIKPSPLSKIPFLRGFYALFISLYYGVKGLNESAEISSGEEMKNSEKYLSLVLALGLAVGLFILLPILITNLLDLKKNEFVYSLVEGFIRLGLFLLYVWIVSLFPDVKRVFQYHGAEHMVVNAFESGEALSSDKVKNYSTIHPRCGTNFAMIFLMLAIVLLSAVGAFVPMNFWTRLLSRLLLLPIVAGLSYEVLKLIALFRDNKILKALYLPGYLLQYLTTSKPDDSQIEVAILALEDAIGRVGSLGEELEVLG